MNIYEKLQKIRVALQELKLKKSGKNKFAGYDYYELHDFLPTINELMLKNKLSSMVCFGKQYAKLTIINIETPEEQITFSSPMSSAALKGCHDVQNLGAVQTYLRRYLYTNAFEIVEHDGLDKTLNPNKPIINPPSPAQRKMTQANKTPIEGGKTCPHCGKTLVIRRRKDGAQFLGCPGFPDCKYATSIKKPSNESPAPTDEDVPF